MEKAIRGVIESSWPTLAVLLAIFIIIRTASYFRGEDRHFVLHEELFKLLFMTYLIMLFQLVTSQDISAFNSTNFIPFKEILRYNVGTVNFNKQVIGNILLFIPFGYFVSSYSNIKNLGTISLVSFLSSLVIEIVQHFIGRSFDVDDIILNVVGGILGFLVFISLDAIKNHMPNMFRKDWFYNLLSILIIVVIALYLIKIL